MSPLYKTRAWMAVAVLVLAFAMSLSTGVLCAWADSGVFGTGNSDVTEEQRDTAGNMVAVGNGVTVNQDAERDIMAFGNTVAVEEISVGGDVISAGQRVDIGSAQVSGNVRAAGNEVYLSGTQVEGNATVAGSSVGFDEGFKANAVYAAGANVSFSGSCEYVYIAAGGRAYFDGEVDGDVTIDASSVSIGKNARISGTLTVVGAQPNVDDAASIGSLNVQLAQEGSSGNVLLKSLANAIVMLLTMGVTIAVVFWLAPTRPQDSLYMFQARTVPMVVTGIVAVVAMPFVVAMLLVTGVGAYLAIAILCIAVALAVLGLPFMAAAIASRLVGNSSLVTTVLVAAAIAGMVSVLPGISIMGYVCGGAYLTGYILQLLFLKLQARKQLAA